MGPCRNCSKRVLGCHSNCKDYIDWKKNIDAVNEKRRSIERSKYYGKKYYKESVHIGRSKVFEEL